jgi:hypothetical protein
MIMEARKRMEKNTKKRGKSAYRERFLRLAEELGLDEKGMVSVVCVRKKDDKKKA